MKSNVGLRDAPVDKKPTKLGFIAKDERRCQHVRSLTSALSGRDIYQYLVTAGVFDGRPSRRPASQVGDAATNNGKESQRHAECAPAIVLRGLADPECMGGPPDHECETDGV